MLLEKANITSLQNTIETQKQQIETLECQINELHRVIDEKEKCNMHFSEREKLLEEQKSEVFIFRLYIFSLTYIKSHVTKTDG